MTVKVVSETEIFDIFSIDTTSDYAVNNSWINGKFGSFLYDSQGKRVQGLTGDNVSLQISKEVSKIDTVDL